MAIFGPDLSSFQGNPNMPQVAAADNTFCIIKATEGVGYVNPFLAETRDNAHAAGMLVGLYGFARNGDPIAEAQFFVNTIGGLRDNEFPVEDWEVAGDAANWSKAWLDEVLRLTGVKPFVYLNQYYVNNFDWSAVAGAGYPLWLALYDGDPYTFQPMRFWGAPPLKQYTDAASIPGIAGACDRNSFNGSRADLLAYCKGGIAPTQERVMPYIVQTPDGSAYVVDFFGVQHIPDPPTLDSYKASGLPVAQITPDQLSLQIRDAGARYNGLLTDLSRWVLCRTPDDKTGAWLWDRVAGVDDKTGGIADVLAAVKALQVGAVDPAVIKQAVEDAVSAEMAKLAALLRAAQSKS